MKTIFHACSVVIVLSLLCPSLAPAYQADSRNTGDTPVFFESPGVPAATNRVIWFVADTNGDGVPTAPPAGGVLGPDDRLLFVDTLDGMLLGEHAGKHQRLNIPVPAEYASAPIYVYLWNVPWDEPVGTAGQTFAVESLGPRPPPTLGNADWSVSTSLVATANIQPSERSRFDQLLDQHHDLGSPRPVGERLYYVVTDAQDQWRALLLFSAAAKHLKARERWIGWTHEQARRRRKLVVNNSRFLPLPDQTVPNLATKALRLVLDRLSSDWQAHYGHPVLVVETFVDPARFCGTVYTANGWVELGPTDGWGRHRRDYYVKHDQPKRLFARELCRTARRSLQAEHLKPELAAVEAAVPARCTKPVKEIRSMTEQFRQVPEYRERVESYPLWSLATIVLLAVLCEAPRGQKDLQKFARGFSQAQRRALGMRRNRQGRYPAPHQSTFCRFFQQVAGLPLEAAILAIQQQARGQPPQPDLVVIDGKEPKHGGGQIVLSAVTVPSQFYLGSAIVEKDKTNEIPVARDLFAKLDLEGRLVSRDALHTQDETARTLVLEHGADYLLTVKDNQATIHRNIEQLVTAPRGDFPPSAADGDASAHAGNQQGSAGESIDFHSHADRRTNRLSLR